uniref:OBP5 protein n=1 Tax=Locusta migratoria TaxID=7004 RepID=H2CSM9_LOCMI|nr:OBP5 protein [Locusta migratoria]
MCLVVLLFGFVQSLSLLFVPDSCLLLFVVVMFYFPCKISQANGSFVMTMLCLEQTCKMMDQLHQTCVGESGVSEGNIDAARKGNFIDDGNLKCYMKCIFVQMTCMSDDGVFDADTAIAMLPDNLKDVASKALNACKGEKGSDACDTAFKINQCLFKQAPKDYILV